MHLTGNILIVTGVIVIVVSLMQWRHKPDSNSRLSVHKSLSDERIAVQFSKGLRRSEASLGLGFGGLLVFAGFVSKAVAWFFPAIG